jgi:muramoyltetrapeptide carboxypeptidase LdcA involved in peptidoglycan recycling
VLIVETSEEIPSADYVWRVFRALGERGILARVQGFLVGRPKAWDFGREQDNAAREHYRETQRATIRDIIRYYNPTAPIVQNLDFGHTDPQIPIPLGMPVSMDTGIQEVAISF